MPFFLISSFRSVRTILSSPQGVVGFAEEEAYTKKSIVEWHYTIYLLFCVFLGTFKDHYTQYCTTQLPFPFAATFRFLLFLLLYIFFFLIVIDEKGLIICFYHLSKYNGHYGKLLKNSRSQLYLWNLTSTVAEQMIRPKCDFLQIQNFFQNLFSTRILFVSFFLICFWFSMSSLFCCYYYWGQDLVKTNILLCSNKGFVKSFNF